LKKHHFLFACSFFFALGHNIMSFSLIYRLVDTFSFTTGKIGTYIAIGQLFYFLGCNLYHRFGHIINPAKIIPVSTAAVFLASIPLGYFRILMPVYVSYWVLQLSASFFWPPIQAWLTEGLAGAELGQKISHFNRSWMGALIIAPPIAGFLYRLNSDINFFAISLSYFAAFMFIFLIKRYGKDETGAEDNTAEKITVLSNTDIQNPSPVLQNRKLDLYRYVAWTVFYCSIMFAAILINFMPIHIRDGLGQQPVLCFLSAVPQALSDLPCWGNLPPGILISGGL
jgi:MFS family permease